MSNLVSLKFVQKRMKISRGHCWTMFGRGTKGLVSEDRILEILNAKSLNMDSLVFIPGDLLTLEEAENEVMLNGQPIPHARLLGWVNNESFRVPHIKFSSHLIRIPKYAFNNWVSQMGELA